MTWQTLLTILHVVGTALGVGGATFAEIFYVKAMRDGVIDPRESEFLQITYRVLRIGMVLLVLSGFGFLLLYRITDQTELLYNPKLWAKLTIILILLFSVIAWHAKKIPFWLGSAGSLTSWYAALVLGIWRTLEASYGGIIITYFAVTVLIALHLSLLRKVLIKKTLPKP